MCEREVGLASAHTHTEAGREVQAGVRQQEAGADKRRQQETKRGRQKAAGGNWRQEKAKAGKRRQDKAAEDSRRQEQTEGKSRQHGQSHTLSLSLYTLAVESERDRTKAYQAMATVKPHNKNLNMRSCKETLCAIKG